MLRVRSSCRRRAVRRDVGLTNVLANFRDRKFRLKAALLCL